MGRRDGRARPRPPCPLGLAERLGLPRTAPTSSTSAARSTTADHALLYVAQSLPDRRRPEAEPALHDELEALITAAGGRTLALFTSWRAMRAAVEALPGTAPVPVLAQSDLPKPALVEAFRADESTCLFATLGSGRASTSRVGPSAWSPSTGSRSPARRPGAPGPAGPGRDRGLRRGRPAPGGHPAGPGGRPADPLPGDRGVVAVLDSRLATAGYRGALLARVPPDAAHARPTPRSMEFLAGHRRRPTDR